MIAAKGDSVMINITLRGLNSDNYTYHWRRLNGSLPDTASGENTPNLIINSVSPSDSGSYYCVLESYLSDSVESDRATLQVFCKLEITLWRVQLQQNIHTVHQLCASYLSIHGMDAKPRKRSSNIHDNLSHSIRLV